MSAEKYRPDDINGFIPGSVNLMGMILPANLQARNRSAETTEGIVRSIFAEQGACDEYASYLSSSPKLMNFQIVDSDKFDPSKWSGFSHSQR